jgi:hypothetical protein
VNFVDRDCQDQVRAESEVHDSECRLTVPTNQLDLLRRSEMVRDHECYGAIEQQSRVPDVVETKRRLCMQVLPERLELMLGRYLDNEVDRQNERAEKGAQMLRT